jgi:4'-phosphopantetheinyl transferase
MWLKVYGVSIEENDINDEMFDGFLNIVSPEKRQRIQRFKRKEDIVRALIGDILARYTISNATGFSLEELIFTKNAYGKPLLKYPTEDIHFNISHSGKWVVCAIDERPLGIDIEKIKTVEFDIAKRFFSEQEYQDLMKKEVVEQLDYFYDLWTLKESYIKYVGKGLSMPLNSFTINMTADSINLNSVENTTQIYFQQYDFDIEFKCSLCAEQGSAQEKIELLSCSELYEGKYYEKGFTYG